MFPWKLCSQHNCTCYALSSLIGILRPLPAQLDMTVYAHMKNTCTSLYHNCPDLVAMETSDHVDVQYVYMYVFIYTRIHTHTYIYGSVCVRCQKLIHVAMAPLPPWHHLIYPLFYRPPLVSCFSSPPFFASSIPLSLAPSPSKHEENQYVFNLQQSFPPLHPNQPLLAL